MWSETWKVKVTAWGGGGGGGVPDIGSIFCGVRLSITTTSKVCDRPAMGASTNH